MTPLLIDRRLEEQVERDGFVVVPLLLPEQVAELRALYARHIRADAVDGLYESSRHNPYDVNRTINEMIREHVTSAGRDLFAPVRIYGGSFMVKAASRSDVLPLHQDWSVVEEDRFRTLFLWCPLVDVDAANGGLYVLPGSHRYFQSLRSGSYPSDRFVLPPNLHAHVQNVPLRAGEAILYYDRLFHGSHANSGSRDRIVITARVMEPAAELVYFHKAGDHEVDVVAADESFYLTHIDSLAHGRLPADAVRRARRPYTHVAVTDATLQSAIRRHFPAPEVTPAMTPLFKDSALQSAFDRDGYAVIDLIERPQVDALREFYGGLAHAATPAGGFQVSLDHESPAFVRTVSERLIGTVAASVDRYFRDHRIFTASFVTKARDPIGVVPPHQDWTFVDEREFWSATIWCPLVDVDRHNGGLGVIAGSHRLYDHVRPSPSPQFAPPFHHQLARIFPYVRIVPLRAGQALVFDNRTIHASPPNTSDQTRVAFGIGVTHRDAHLRHYYVLPNRPSPQMEGYEVTPDFFHHYNNARLAALHREGRKPEGLTSIGVFAAGARQYDTEQLLGLFRAAGNHEDPELAAVAPAIFGSGAMGGMSPGAGAAAPAAKLPLWKIYTPGNILREIRYRLARR